MNVPAYRVPLDDRLRARLARREYYDRLAADGTVRVTVAPSDPRAPVTDQHTSTQRREP